MHTIISIDLQIYFYNYKRIKKIEKNYLNFNQQI